MTRCRMILNLALLALLFAGFCTQPILAKEAGESVSQQVKPKVVVPKDADVQRPDDPAQQFINPNEIVVPYREGLAIGDNCSDPIVVTLPAALPYADLNQTNCGRANDYSSTCLGSYDGGEDIVYMIKVTSPVTVNITLNPKGTTWTGFAIDLPTACPLDAGTSDCIAKSTNSGGTAHSIIDLALAPGDYYLMVDTYPSPTCIPNFDLNIITTPPPPVGATCAVPLELTLGTASLPYTASGLTTCGMINNYSSTCMDYYDGGEDLIMKLVLTDAVLMDITLNPNGAAYTGFAIDNVCPLDAAIGSCLGFSSNSLTTAHSLYGLNLPAGTYWIMVDTWPSPNCIPTFSLTFAGAAPPPPNDNCANATPVGDVVNLPFDNAPASHDGSGTCSTAGKNLWYCFTAPMTGNATISLCGSSFDTKLAVYDGCGCTPLGAQLACADDECSLQSEAVVGVVAGQQYQIEVTGYSATSVGTGVLNITTAVAPPNDDCEDVTPVVLTSGVPVTFTGDNTGAGSDCPSFPGNNAWEAFTITECSNVTLDYCGTSPAFENAWLNLAVGCPCASFTTGAAFDVSTCGDGNVTMTWSALPAGTYYYPVLTEAGAVGPYTMHVVANPVVAYCAGSGGCDEYIGNVTLADLNNSSSCGGYSNYTSMSASLVQTVPYTITVTNGLPYTGDQCAVWIDWDGDLCFSASEQITMTGGPASWTGTVTAQLTDPVGPTRMRVRINYNAAPPVCGTTTYGEVEDYTVNVIAYAPTAKVDPYTQYQYQRFAVTPIIDVFHFGMFNGGYTANDVNLSTVKINALFTPTSISVVPSAPGFAGPVVRAELPLSTFLGWWFYVNNYLYDVNNANFAVMGKFNDNVNFSIIGDVVIVGKSSVVPSTYILPDGDEVVLPGDFNIDGALNVSDAVGIINYIFAGGSAPSNLMIIDTDCSRGITISDAVYMINYIFGGGPAPCVASN